MPRQKLRPGKRNPPISKVPPHQRQQLLDDLNYLNIEEIKTFCRGHFIPFKIAIETPGGRKTTTEEDRKGVILDRIRHFLATGVIAGETCFPKSVVAVEAPSENLTPADRLFYGHYDKKNQNLMAVLQELTAGHFRNGAVARILLREFWGKGKAPTLQEYAGAWLQAVKDHRQPNPEWAFLSDLARGQAGPEWKKLRAKKAAKVIRQLKQITR